MFRVTSYDNLGKIVCDRVAALASIFIPIKNEMHENMPLTSNVRFILIIIRSFFLTEIISAKRRRCHNEAPVTNCVSVMGKGRADR